MNNSTPGPWIATTWETTTPEGRFETYASVQHPLEDGGFIFICDCWGLEDEETHGVRLPTETARANARLIAAAPEMRRVLEGTQGALRRALEMVHPDFELAQHLGEWLDEIKHVLTAARGCERECPVDGMVCDGCAGVRTPCEDAPEIEQEKCKKLAPVLLPALSRFMGENGPTGHGDICHSDADPGL